MAKCITCDNTLQGRQTKFCNKKCKNSNLQSYDAQQKRGESRKKHYVLKAGGKCSKCGYDRNLGAMHFHHLDEKHKLFSLDSRSLSNRTIQVIEVEFLKCILLCANCHMELHNPRLNDWQQTEWAQ